MLDVVPCSLIGEILAAGEVERTQVRALVLGSKVNLNVCVTTLSDGVGYSRRDNVPFPPKESSDKSGDG